MATDWQYSYPILQVMPRVSESRENDWICSAWPIYRVWLAIDKVTVHSSQFTEVMHWMSTDNNGRSLAYSFSRICQTEGDILTYVGTMKRHVFCVYPTVLMLMWFTHKLFFPLNRNYNYCGGLACFTQQKKTEEKVRVWTRNAFSLKTLPFPHIVCQ